MYECYPNNDRLCRRVLMFHHFPEELGTDDYLVRSTEFNYKETPIASFINSVAQSGYVRQTSGTYLKKLLPPREFEYSKAVIQNHVHEAADDKIFQVSASGKVTVLKAGAQCRSSL